MTVSHKNLTEANLHETKGVSTASADTVHVRASAGVSGWTKINKNNIDTASIKNINYLTLQTKLDDISTASTTYLVSPVAGTVKAIYCVTNAATTVASAVITPKIVGVAMTDGAITVPVSGSGAGVTYNSTPTAGNTVTAGQAISIESDGGSTTTCPASFTIVIEMA